MSQNKVFAGPRIRRLRNGLGLNQSAMAAALGISPSYLNLVERDQRPLTVQLLVKLSQTYDVDLSDLGGTDRAATVAALRQVFSDPLLAGELPGEGELVEIADAAPNAAAAIGKLHRAYREMEARLADLTVRLGTEGAAADRAPARMPLDEVREVFEDRPNHHPAMEAAAETLRAEIGSGDDPAGSLRRWLRERHDVAVRILPVETMPHWRRRFDRHSRRLFLSERLGAADCLREMAAEAVRLHAGEAVAREAESFALRTAEATRLAVRELTQAAALALLMPYGPFQAAAEGTGSDVIRLAQRFSVSVTDAAERLTSLVRRGAPGLPFFFQESDVAGNVLRRRGARGFPRARFGGECVKLPQHRAVPGGGVVAERAMMANGEAYLLLAHAAVGGMADPCDQPRRTAVLLGCEFEAARGTVYARALRDEAPALPIGPACRHCERELCLARAAPPLTRPLGLDEWVGGLTPFDFR